MDQKLEKILALVNKLSSEVKSLKSQPRSAWIAPVGTRKLFDYRRLLD